MAIDVNLKDVLSGFDTAASLNANSAAIENALAKALNTDSNSPENAMKVPLDMGINSIFNLKQAVLNHEAVNLQQVQDIISAITDEVVSTITIEDRVYALGGQTEIDLQKIVYTPATNSLMVFKNGVYQRAGFEYQETDSTTITFTSALSLNDEVDIFGSRYDAQQYVDLAITAASNAATSEANAATSATDAQDAATLATAAAGYKLDINNQNVVSYTLQISDEGDFIRLDNTDPNQVNIPTNSTVPFEIGTVVLVRQVGEGTTTINPELGVTLNAPFDNYEISAEDFGIGLVKVDTDTWDMVKAFGGVDTSQLAEFSTEFDARLEEIQTELLSANPTFVVDFESLRNDLTPRLDAVEDDFATLEANTNTAVSNLISSFNTLDNDFNVLSDRFDILDADQGTLNTEFDVIQTQFTQVQQDVADVEDLVSNIDPADYEASLNQEGYQKLPSGLIMQWGRITDFTGGYPSPVKLITYPIPFPNQVLNLSISYDSSVGKYADSPWIYPATGADAKTKAKAQQLGVGSTTAYWFAIGH